MKILIASITDSGIVRARTEIIQRLIEAGHRVTVAAPESADADKLKALTCGFIPVSIDQHGKSILKDYKLYRQYRKILLAEKPDAVLTYTIKPNVYCGYAASRLKIPYMCNITGLGRALQTPGLTQKLATILYKISLKRAAAVFFQNEGNMKYFADRGIASK